MILIAAFVACLAICARGSEEKEEAAAPEAVASAPASNSAAPAADSSRSIAAKCYVCNEADDRACGDSATLKKEHIQECKRGETFCRKIVQNVENEKHVIRQCAKELYKPNYSGCYKTAGKATQHVCTCEASSKSGEPCNAAPKVAPKSAAFALLLSALVARALFI